MNQPGPLFSPIRNKRTFERVSGKIKGLIFEGVLKPGDQLPSEMELARQFDVSRQTIREALRILELAGFITVQKGGSGGPVIKDTLINSISNLYQDAFRMEKITIGELTSVRCDIEKAMLSHVIDKVDENDIKRLQANVREARQKIDANQLATHENIEFHNLLAKASKNHVYVVVVGSITAAVRDLLTRLSSTEGAAELPTGYEEFMVNTKNAVASHEELLSAIMERDRDRAVDLLEQHLHEVGNRLEKLID